MTVITDSSAGGILVSASCAVEMEEQGLSTVA